MINLINEVFISKYICTLNNCVKDKCYIFINVSNKSQKSLIILKDFRNITTLNFLYEKD